LNHFQRFLEGGRQPKCHPRRSGIHTFFNGPEVLPPMTATIWAKHQRWNGLLVGAGLQLYRDRVVWWWRNGWLAQMDERWRAPYPIMGSRYLGGAQPFQKNRRYLPRKRVNRNTWVCFMPITFPYRPKWATSGGAFAVAPLAYEASKGRACCLW